MTLEQTARQRRHAVQTRSRKNVAAPRAADDMGPCPYCGKTYHPRAASVHFIPCPFCNSLEHAGCQH